MIKIWNEEHDTAVYVDRVVGIRKIENYNGQDDYIWEGGGCVGSVWTIALVLDTGEVLPFERVRVSNIPRLREKYHPTTYVDERIEHWLSKLDGYRTGIDGGVSEAEKAIADGKPRWIHHEGFGWQHVIILGEDYRHPNPLLIYRMARRKDVSLENHAMMLVNVDVEILPYGETPPPAKPEKRRADLDAIIQEIALSEDLSIYATQMVVRPFYSVDTAKIVRIIVEKFMEYEIGGINQR